MHRADDKFMKGGIWLKTWLVRDCYMEEMCLKAKKLEEVYCKP